MLLTEYKLSDIGSIITGKTPPGSKDESFGGNVFFLTPTDMDGARTPSKIERTLSELGKQQLLRLIVPKGVAVSCIGSQMGKSCLIKTPFVTNQQINTIVPKESKVDLYFLYYLLSSMREYLFRLGVGAGSTMPILNKGNFENITVCIPELSEQKKIAAILSILDDKIELNNLINETLESMAKAIFKEWFIDFGPVKAKAEGKKPYGMNDETASLFPDSFEESELGLIPKGWRVLTYSNVMEHTKDSVNPETFELVECIHYSLPNFDTGRNAKIEKITEIKSNKFRVHHNSILFSKLNPRTPRVWIANHNESETQMAIGSTEFVVICPTVPENRWLIYCLLNESMFLDRMSQTATGTSNSHQRIKPESIFETKWAAPNKDIIEHFHNAVQSLFELSLNNLKEIQHLTQTRDLLLPKLISGEIELKEIQ